MMQINKPTKITINNDKNNKSINKQINKNKYDPLSNLWKTTPHLMKSINQLMNLQ
jgi:hypothetical protein